jgi:hypothetical protein
MRHLIKKYLIEAVGVPPEIEKSANKLFYDITNEFDKDNFQNEYYFNNSNGKYNFADFKFSGIDFKIELKTYGGGELVFAGFGFGNQSSVNRKGKLTSDVSGDLYLQATVAVPQNLDNLDAEDIANLFKK